MELREGKIKDQKDRLPLDTKLLAEAIIELNISRRSVSLYPGEHPITRESLKRAFELLKKIFEIRPSITLGIAKDHLIVDEFVLEKRILSLERLASVFTKKVLQQ